MESKKTKYFLLIAFFSIWSLLGYRVYQRMTSDDESKIVDDGVIKFSNHVPVKVDSFSLLINYDDPFLKNEIWKKNKAKNKQVDIPQSLKKAKLVKPSPPSIVFPEVIYKGILKLEFGEPIALVSIDGENQNMENDEIFKGVRLMKVFPDSILVVFQKEKKTIHKTGS